jgi:tRNA/rRNA methyltransferase
MQQSAAPPHQFTPDQAFGRDVLWPFLPTCRPGPAFILVSTSGSANLGSIARVMRNFGFGDLRLVNPLVKPSDPDAERMAMRARATLQHAARQTYSSLPEALHDIHTVVATSGRMPGRSDSLPFAPVDQVFGGRLQALLPEGGEGLGPGVAFVFGNEESGLSNEDLRHAHLILSLPTDPALPSLNLAQAVAIVCYEACRSKMWSSSPHLSPEAAPRAGAARDHTAPGKIVDALLDDLGNILLEVGFFLPHTRRASLAQLGRMLRDSRPSLKDAALLGAMLRHVRRRLVR